MFLNRENGRNLVISVLVKHLSAENQSGFLSMFFDSVYELPYPFAFSLPVLCQEQYIINKIFKIRINHSLRLSGPLFVIVFQIWRTPTSPMPFLGRFYQHLHYVNKKSNSVLSTKFS